MEVCGLGPDVPLPAGLAPEWEDLIRMCMGWKSGKLEGVWIKDGRPTDVDVARQHVKLGKREVMEFIPAFISSTTIVIE